MDDYRYYRNESQDGRIYRMKLDESDSEQLFDLDNCKYINISNDVIVFYKIMSQTHYKANIDGTNLEEFI